MSVFTTQVRWIIESGKTLSLDAYPIFDEGYRATLNQKIIQHFYFREIGFETVGLFNNRLAAKMNEIMPYYNQLYKTQGLQFNPLINRLYQESFSRATEDTGLTTRTETGDQSDIVNSSTTLTASGQKTNTENRQGSASENEDRESEAIGSDTPQGFLSSENVFEAGTYASTASKGKEGATRARTDEARTTATEGTAQDQSGTGREQREMSRNLRDNTNTSANRWETFTRSLEGLEGTSQAELLLKFRETFLNIDMMIIEELETLFMQIWE